MLSQWRASADDGQGYSIGFNEDDILIDQKLPIESNDIVNCIGLYPVIYDEHDQNTIIENYLNNIFIGKDLHEQCYNLSKYISVFKNPAFKEEKEWRIIYTHKITMGKDGKAFDFDIKNKISDYGFNSTKFGIFPYFKWEFKDQKIFPIKEIVIGPQNRTLPDNLAFFYSL